MGYECIICKENFFNGLRIFIKTKTSLRTCYVCDKCQEGKTESEICIIAERKHNARYEFAGVMA